MLPYAFMRKKLKMSQEPHTVLSKGLIIWEILPRLAVRVLLAGTHLTLMESI